MRKVTIILLVLSLTGSAFAVTFTPELVTKLNSSADNELIRILITMEEQAEFAWMVDMTAHMSKSAKRQFVVNHLQQLAEGTQTDVIAYLADWEPAGKVQRIQSVSLVNLIHCLATPEVIRGLMDYSEIAGIDYDPERYMLSDAPKSAKPAESDEVDEVAWGVADVYAPEVWQQGFDGTGVIVSVVDTGVNYNHLDLADHLWDGGPSYPNHGWDFYNNDNDPMDEGPMGHGTHCAGSVASDGTAGSQCGVAPNASIMAVQVLSGAGYGSEGQIISGIDFSVAQGADIFSMSLGHAGGGTVLQKQQYRTACINALAAGVIGSVAAGNENGSYPPPNNVRVPGNCPPPWLHPDQILVGGLSCVVTIGATQPNHSIATFSSRGPVTWGTIDPWYDYAYSPGMGLIDPDISGPGTDIKSCLYSNNSGYTFMSGTSMATPHVAGGMALLLSKDPNLTPDLIDMYLETYAEDLGTPGKDNTFGSGLMNCLNSINAIILGPGPNLIISNKQFDDIGGNNNGAPDPGETCSLVVTLKNIGQDPGTNIIGTLSTTDPYLSITQTTSNFPDLANLEEGQGSPAYTFDVSSSCPEGQNVTCDLHITADSAFVDDVVITFIVGSPMNNPSGPDAYGYLAYDPYDAPELPTYQWVEICADSGGPGSLVNFTLDDQVFQYVLPFTFQYYGNAFDTVSVAANGWIGMGVTTVDDYSNSGIPDSDGPPNMIAPYWEDLSPQRANSGKVWNWYDAANHLYIVEWNYIEQYAPTGSFETFQVVLLDPDYYPTGSGDGQILFQYKDMSTTAISSEGTIGIENSTEVDGIEYVFDGSYDMNAHPLEDGFAILYTTMTFVPQVSIDLTYVSGSPVPVGGGNLNFEVFAENIGTVPLNFDGWLDVIYEGGAPTTVALRSFSSFQPGWTINRPDMFFPVPGTYAGGNYIMNGRLGNHPGDIWDESSFAWSKTGASTGEFVPFIPQESYPDPFDRITTGDEGAPSADLPFEYALYQNYPNPFNPTTTISYALPEAGKVSLMVYDISGRQVATLVDGYRNAGSHHVQFDAQGLASGVYIYRMEARSGSGATPTTGFTATGKLVLMK
ncbi:S8 family serine peptidase [bacterium]|nr:S8 family serine peptidase [bacterium]